MPKPDRKMVAPRLSPGLQKWILEHFDNLHAGASYILEAWPIAYRRTLLDIKGRFSEGELSLLIDVFNGTLLTPGMAGQHLLVSASDGIALDSLHEKWNVEADGFLGRLHELTTFQATSLEIWARGFWISGQHRKKGGLAGYVKKLT